MKAPTQEDIVTMTGNLHRLAQAGSIEALAIVFVKKDSGNAGIKMACPTDLYAHILMGLEVGKCEIMRSVEIVGADKSTGGAN